VPGYLMLKPPSRQKRRPCTYLDLAFNPGLCLKRVGGCSNKYTESVSATTATSNGNSFSISCNFKLSFLFLYFFFFLVDVVVPMFVCFYIFFNADGSADLFDCCSCCSCCCHFFSSEIVKKFVQSAALKIWR